MKRLYEPIYRIVELFKVPVSWVFGSKPELAELVETGRVPPGRAIDLGCGAGLEAIYLSRSGFDVTGVDFSPTAIRLARKRARAEGAEVNFVKDDLTELRHVSGAFDFLVDFGTLDDLSQEDRDSYMKNVLPLSHRGSRFLLKCFENELPSDEVERRFGDHFSIEALSTESESLFGRTITIYLMTRE